MAIRLQTDAPIESKQGTVFLSTSATGLWTELDDDLGQYFSNATAGAGTMTMTSPASDRLDWTDTQTMVFQAEAANPTSGTLFTHDAGGAQTMLDVSGGTLRATIGGSIVGSLSIPGLAGAAAAYVFAWASRPNPLTTGAGDAVQSWLYVIDVPGTQVARTEFTHAVSSASTATATWGTYTDTITDIHHLASTQSFTEVAIDTGYTSPSGPSTVAALELPPPPLESAITIGDEDHLQGPVVAWAAVHASHARRRTWTPLANERYRSLPEVRNSTAAGDQAYRLAPGSTLYYMQLGWRAEAPVPPGATHLWVRVQVQSWVTGGAAVPIGLRVYSLSKPPDQIGGSLDLSYVGEVVTRDDTASGDGQWDIEAVMPISAGSDGWTFLCPAYAFDPAGASANDANARIIIGGFHAVPIFAEVDGGV